MLTNGRSPLAPIFAPCGSMPPRRNGLRLVYAAALLACCNPARSRCQDPGTGPDPDVSSAISSLKNSDIDWGETTFGRAGPKLVGSNATSLMEQGAKRTKELIPLLDDPQTFVAAHVLLTKLWRIPSQDKELISVPISTGYFVSYNRLTVRIEWADKQGEMVKTITIPDEDCQRKRIRDWWMARYRDYADEFSPTTKVD